MTNQEFSDTFTTLLNSYNTQAQFGEQASKREIVLDEYEKSVLLTQAQDIIVKSYFDGSLNPQGQGFDDSTRRQVDFSSLIKVAELDKATTDYATFDERGIIYQMPKRPNSDAPEVLFILNESLIKKTYVSFIPIEPLQELNDGDEGKEEGVEKEDDGLNSHEPLPATSSAPTIEFPVKDRMVSTQTYVIVPINYREYDREMSKPYAQPLKKQAWRLFQNNSTGFDVNSELIPRWNIKEKEEENKTVKFVYKIRYVKRPRPIVLEDLPDELSIDGVSEETSCELNPVLHIDVLNKAVEIAIATRGGSYQTAVGALNNSSPNR